jgi:shikimate dehydrogenase
MKPPLSKDTAVCISLAARPSNIGTRFHNYLYDALGLDFIYKAFSTGDIAAAIGGVRALGIRGCSVSMPFKQQVIALLDVVEPAAKAIDAVNTIVNDDGRLTGTNTDYIAVQALVGAHHVDPAMGALIRGSGGMASAVATALRDLGFNDAVIVARNEQAGRQLAGRLGFRWRPDLTGLAAPILVNATPIGMAGGPGEGAAAFDDTLIGRAHIVFDVVAVPSETPLVAAARAAGTETITGAEVIALQAAEQFERYTGVRPSRALIEAASAFSRDHSPPAEHR